MTATVSFDKTSPQEAGTSVTASVTLTGTPTAAGTHGVNLTSVKAGLSGAAQMETVTAGQDLTASPVTKTFSFIIPGAKSVTSDAGSGTITAVFQSPPGGYMPDGDGFAA